MKLNHECIRKTLLYFEDVLDIHSPLNLSGFTLEGFSRDDTVYTIKKLSEVEYIKATIVYDINDEFEITIYEITWEGHKFLDTIRDNKVWSETKNILSKVSSCSISFVSNIASQVLTNLINEHLTFIQHTTTST